MTKIRLAKAAERDLASIRRYSEQKHGRARADAYLRSFNGALGRLSEHPLIGSERPTLPGGIRGLSCGRHVILYKVVGPDLLVVRIVHQSQDVPPAESLQ